jgi:hypothetical protein
MANSDGAEFPRMNIAAADRAAEDDRFKIDASDLDNDGHLSQCQCAQCQCQPPQCQCWPPQCAPHDHSDENVYITADVVLALGGKYYDI